MFLDPIFLDVEDVLAIHNNTIRREGGADGLRDSGLLESAVAMPRQRFGGEYLHADLAAMAGAYQYHLAMNHPFVDGNKRVAALSTLVFLRANGVPTVSLPSGEVMTELTLRLASSEITKPDLIDWWRQRLEAA
ncbi:MAG: type II toxin-antitoxin system death-on-curing family toxin [Planctomycetota bacterium]